MYLLAALAGLGCEGCVFTGLGRGGGDGGAWWNQSDTKAIHCERCTGLLWWHRSFMNTQARTSEQSMVLLALTATVLGVDDCGVVAYRPAAR